MGLCSSDLWNLRLTQRVIKLGTCPQEVICAGMTGNRGRGNVYMGRNRIGFGCLSKEAKRRWKWVICEVNFWPPKSVKMWEKWLRILVSLRPRVHILQRCRIFHVLAATIFFVFSWGLRGEKPPFPQFFLDTLSLICMCCLRIANWSYRNLL